MPFALKLTHDEPRLVELALVYHLARPGSELDPETRMPAAHGLAEVHAALEGQLQQAGAIIELDESQFRRLLSAIYGSVNELRVLHMRGGASGAVPGFAERASALFPQIARDPDQALDIAEAMMMLHRRMERAVSEANVLQGDETPERRPRWPFGRKRPGAGGGA